jgi:CelD/BcsL family acetyltransferase involved in cellulose biosynthesis
MGRSWRWIAAADWDRAVDASPGATGFHSRPWMEALAAWDPRFEPRALGFQLDDGSPAVFPMLVRRGVLRRGPFARAVSSHPSVYGGPICPERRLGDPDWRTVLDALDRAPLGRVECFGNPLQPLPDDAAARLRCRESATQVVDLSALPEDTLESYSSSCRRAVRKALKEGVTVARETGGEAVAQYFAVYRDSLRRWGERDGYPRSLFERLVRVPEVELWCARSRDGRVAAGGLFLFARSHCVYWQGAMLEELASMRPANALHHALIEEARRRGCELYDFNPSAGLSGVEEFKSSFGARPLAVRAWRHRHPLVAKLDRRG